MYRKDIIGPWRRALYGPADAAYIWEHSTTAKFSSFINKNKDLDIHTKRAALKCSKSIVSLTSHSGGNEIFTCSGTLIECDERDGTFFGTVLTSATLLRGEAGDEPDDIQVKTYLHNGQLCHGQVLAKDYHYNVAIIKIQSDVALPTAMIKLLDDCGAVLAPSMEHPNQLPPHSNLFKLLPGDKVIPVGRHFQEPYDLMAASGVFSIDDCKFKSKEIDPDSEFECKDLFRANCRITKCGIGGPVINCMGEVIGISFYSLLHTPFLPINVVWKWWNHYKKFEVHCRPWFGIQVTNLYAARLSTLELVIGSTSNTFEGVFVRVVSPGSPAYSAGIRCDDVIIRCGGKSVRSVLEVELRRARQSAPIKLAMIVEETKPEKFNSWPIPKAFERYALKVRRY